MTPEFARPVRLDTIGAARAIEIEANEAERAALAARFDLVAIDRLEARFSVGTTAAGIMVDGTVSGAVVQACAITEAPVPAAIDEPVRLLFVTAAPEDEEIELGADEVDTIVLDGGTIDLGEVAAETLALALDPFPRAPDADDIRREAGILSEEEARPANPFAALKART